MAELITQERLQPALLDRLTDAAPFKERVEVTIEASALRRTGIERDELRRVFESHHLRLIEKRPDEAGEHDASGLIEVYESEHGSNGLQRLLEHELGSGGGYRASVASVVNIVDRKRLPNTVESRRGRVISNKQLKECVLRDLAWLLNTANLMSVQELQAYPHARSSVLNYGVPDLTGSTASGADVEAIAAGIRRAIEVFEPRLRRVMVTPAPAEDTAGGGNVLAFRIEAELWGQPAPEQLLLHTELDLESADATIYSGEPRGG
ncbi:type VI secretion system baseplate subunit TssE [Nitrococcus mobilis]|uniref:IraD/Gp25-like domain-containing protein n=1 Tax=Nitrococcus mobilis Nb-231 TaxID=314278 RepID=A4BPJ2_9GAMM|nr:type VI secretion system baseplate subunit TssE [Nitrococcus mobilis]EAR22493.1 hypothetical protein NB231_12174 [Nitrococcus mobilis Nb-231]